MKLLNCCILLAIAASGCTRIVTIEAQMPPLVPGLKGVKTVGVDLIFIDAIGDRTPGWSGRIVAQTLKDELKNSATYTLADAPAADQLVLSGIVTCRVVEKTVKHHSGDVKTQTAEVSIVLTGSTGMARKVFTITESPTIDDKRRITTQPSKPDQLGEALLRICVRRLVADISPRKVRVKIPRPGFMGSEQTRAGIDLLTTNPAAAVDRLTTALEHNDKDAAALNALGFCNEIAGNLEAALSSYLYAAAIDSRAEYGENLERVRALIEHRKRITAPATAPKDKAK